MAADTPTHPEAAGTVVPTASNTVVVSNGPLGVLVQSAGFETVKATATFTGPKGPLLRREAFTVTSKGTPLKVEAGAATLTPVNSMSASAKTPGKRAPTCCAPASPETSKGIQPHTMRSEPAVTLSMSGIPLANASPIMPLCGDVSSPAVYGGAL